MDFCLKMTLFGSFKILRFALFLPLTEFLISFCCKIRNNLFMNIGKINHPIIEPCEIAILALPQPLKFYI